jgi:hypothetical protein
VNLIAGVWLLGEQLGHCKSYGIERLGDRTPLRILVGNHVRAMNANDDADMSANVSGQASVTRLRRESGTHAVANGKARFTGVAAVREDSRSIRCKRRDCGLGPCSQRP